MFDWLCTCVRSTASEQLYLFGGIFMAVTATAWIALAAKAAQVAEERGYSPIRFGLLSLLMPIGYPLYIINNPPPSIVPDLTHAAPKEIPLATAPLQAEYFLGLLQTGAVTQATPCLVVCGDGMKHTVTGITQAQAELIVVTARIGDTPEQRLRIRYASMQNVGQA